MLAALDRESDPAVLEMLVWTAGQVRRERRSLGPTVPLHRVRLLPPPCKPR